MRKLVDDCVGCKDMGLSCLGISCPNKKVETYYCDCDGCESLAYFTLDGIDLCDEHAREYLQDIFDDSTISELAELFGVNLKEV